MSDVQQDVEDYSDWERVDLIRRIEELERAIASPMGEGYISPVQKVVQLNRRVEELERELADVEADRRFQQDRARKLERKEDTLGDILMGAQIMKNGQLYHLQPSTRERYVEELRDRIHDYENSISWNTNCINCAKLMDKNYAQYVLIEELKNSLAISDRRRSFQQDRAQRAELSRDRWILWCERAAKERDNLAERVAQLEESHLPPGRS